MARAERRSTAYGRCWPTSACAAATTWTVTTTQRAEQRGQLGRRRACRRAARPARSVSTDASEQELARARWPGRRTPRRAPTGRLSRHRTPRPSRHQALTPNSRAPPEATRPGRTVIVGHGRLPRDRDQARADRQHQHAAAHRHRPPDRGAVGADQARARSERGIRRAVCVAALSTRSSSRGVRRAARCAGTAPSDHCRHQQGHLEQRVTAHSARTRRRPRPTTNHDGRDPVEQRHRGQPPVCSMQEQPAQDRDSRPDARTTTIPCGPRRTASIAQAMTWAIAVAAASQSSSTIMRRCQAAGAEGVRRRAEQHPRLEQPGDVERGEQECAEVVGGRADRVDATAWSRASSSRPPPEATADTTARARNAGEAGRQQQEHVERVARSPAPAPGRNAGTIGGGRGDGDARPTTAQREQRAGGVPCRRGTAAGARRRATARARLASRGARGRHGRPPRRPSRSRRRSRPASRRAAPAPRRRPGRELAQVGGDQDAGAAGAGVSDHLEGRLDADRVHAVERLVEQQYLRARAARPAPPRAGGPCRGEKPRGHPVGDVAELEPLQQVAGRGPPSRRAGAAGPRAAGAPTGSPGAPGRRRRGSSR